MEENTKLEAIIKIFKNLNQEEKKEKVISLISSLGESEIYSTTLDIIKSFNPPESYLTDIYRTIMETKLKVYEEGQEKEKVDAQEKMKEYMRKLNELSMQQKQKDEAEADALLTSI